MSIDEEVEAAAIEIRLRAELAELRNVLTPVRFLLEELIAVASECYGDGAATVGELATRAAAILARMERL